jgi:hypothetical protein
MEKVAIPGYRLGRAPRRDDPRTLDLASILAHGVPAAPAAFDVTTGIGSWPMYANDQLGDCTCAALGHMLEVWTEQATGTPVLLQDAQIIVLYDLVNGGKDAGANMLDVLHQMRTGAGLAGDHVYAYASVACGDQALVKAAAWLFTGLYIGIRMPLSAQHQVGPGKVWRPVAGPDAAPGSWGGHAVNIVAYDGAGLTCITWGARQKMSWSFWNAYVDECWALLPADYQRMAGQLKSNGLNFAQLDSYLAKVGQVDALTQN